MKVVKGLFFKGRSCFGDGHRVFHHAIFIAAVFVIGFIHAVDVPGDELESDVFKGFAAGVVDRHPGVEGQSFIVPDAVVGDVPAETSGHIGELDGDVPSFGRNQAPVQGGLDVEVIRQLGQLHHLGLGIGDHDQTAGAVFSDAIAGAVKELQHASHSGIVLGEQHDFLVQILGHDLPFACQVILIVLLRHGEARLGGGHDHRRGDDSGSDIVVVIALAAGFQLELKAAAHQRKIVVVDGEPILCHEGSAQHHQNR